jgi:PmbA protein
VLAPVLACVDGKAVMRGVSPWAKKRGELLFDERFSIIDDPTLDGKSGSYPFDGEGVAARRLPLIEKGVLKNFLHNLETAAAVGDEPNGHGTRSSGIAPGVTMVTPGDKASEEMIRGIDEGLLIEQTMGAWAGNPYGGQVTGNIALGYKIEKGKLVGRVKNVVFSLNVFSYLRDHLVGLSSDVRDLGGEILPYIMFKDVVLSTE